jgi:hypothetical protein
MLSSLTTADLFGTRPIPHPENAQACLAGLWLYHDFLDESHRLSQDIENVNGSFWHGIMHRREPDPDNARYWFRRVGEHPIFDPLRQAAVRLVSESSPAPDAIFLKMQSKWDPFAFIDLCEVVRGTASECEQLCRRVQLCEWQLLFDHSYRNALEM